MQKYYYSRSYLACHLHQLIIIFIIIIIIIIRSHFGSSHPCTCLPRQSPRLPAVMARRRALKDCWTENLAGNGGINGGKSGWFPPAFAGNPDEPIDDIPQPEPRPEPLLPRPEPLLPQQHPRWLPQQPPQQVPQLPPQGVTFPCIISDSTLLEYTSESTVVQHGVGSVAGQYGASFSESPSLKPTADQVLEAWRALPSPHHAPRVGFVPADAPYHGYTNTHVPSQILSMTLVSAIPTSTLAEFDARCYASCGIRMFKSKGVHLTVPGMHFLKQALFQWMTACNIDVVICAGWNARSAETEYEQQATFINELSSLQRRNTNSRQPLSTNCLAYA